MSCSLHSHLHALQEATHALATLPLTTCLTTASLPLLPSPSPPSTSCWLTAVRGLTLKDSLKVALNNSWGVMRQGLEQWLKPLEAYHSNTGDMYYVPARFQEAFLQVAPQLQSQMVISEAALPNILGLIRQRPEDVDFVALGWALHDAVSCFYEHAAELLPLGKDLNFSVVRNCNSPLTFWGKQHAQDSSIFAVHPYKLSNRHLARRWLKWWLSQQC